MPDGHCLNIVTCCSGGGPRQPWSSGLAPVSWFHSSILFPLVPVPNRPSRLKQQSQSVPVISSWSLQNLKCLSFFTAGACDCTCGQSVKVSDRHSGAMSSGCCDSSLLLYVCWYEHFQCVLFVLSVCFSVRVLRLRLLPVTAVEVHARARVLFVCLCT